MALACDGSCVNHLGPVRKVHVFCGCLDYGSFNYCEVAIAEDEERGLTVIREDEGA